VIGYLEGDVLYQDEKEVLIKLADGMGYTVFYQGKIFGEKASLYIVHIIKEADEELYGFETIRDKKLFEYLVSVKGVGPKSAQALMLTLDFDQIMFAIKTEAKKTLSKAPGIGPKAAAQIILDLSSKIQTLEHMLDGKMPNAPMETVHVGNSIYQEALLAGIELGFKENQIGPILKDIMENNNIEKPEQLLQQALKEL
jgi:Holliday junction DNA helicase RuvA